MRNGREETVETIEKLGILAAAAKYDVACTSSGVERRARRGSVGNASPAGCCHAFTADGRCITLLKVLLSNACSFSCAYCVNRCGQPGPRCSFEPRELADLTVEFYRRNYIEGLFLSSGVLGGPDETCERMAEVLRVLREEYRFRGYIHVKAIPGASPELVHRLGLLADRMSVNVELPSRAGLEALCPQKPAASIFRPMGQIAGSIAEDAETRALARRRPASAPARRIRNGSAGRAFAPAGQSTQLIVGATPDDDRQILNLSSSLYRTYRLRRVFFSAYLPVVGAPGLPSPGTAVPLVREHRLYQADWLMRYYGFDAGELVDEEHPWLDLDVDPKCAWALAHLDAFPVEVNRAPYETLLRVPGVGVKTARRIVAARRTGALDEDALKRMRVVLKRARHFLTCNGRYLGYGEPDPGIIRYALVHDAKAGSYARDRVAADRQPTLF